MPCYVVLCAMVPPESRSPTGTCEFLQPQISGQVTEPPNPNNFELHQVSKRPSHHTARDAATTLIMERLEVPCHPSSSSPVNCAAHTHQFACATDPLLRRLADAEYQPIEPRSSAPGERGGCPDQSGNGRDNARIGARDTGAGGTSTISRRNGTGARDD